MPGPSSRGLLLWLLLVAAGAALVLWPKAPKGRPVPGEHVLLDVDREMPEGGAVFAFRVERPGTVLVDVDLLGGGPDVAADASVGVPASAAPPAGGPYLPDPTTAHRWRVEGDRTTPVRRTLFAVGTYALRVEPASAPGARVRARVTTVP
jgi:hypothetical protein